MLKGHLNPCRENKDSNASTLVKSQLRIQIEKSFKLMNSQNHHKNIIR